MSDPYLYLRNRLAESKPELAWSPSDASWASRTREALRKLIGVVDEPWPDGQPKIGDQTEGEEVDRFRVTFPSRLGWNASGWLLIPRGETGPKPAVICLPGHGKGADAIVGLAEDDYQADFALQCVRRGWVTLALEQVSFGRNQSARDKEGSSSCFMDSLFTLQLGETMTGWRVRDAMAAVRFLRELPNVDGSKIATLGISGGGLTALWTAALDESICAAGISGYFTPMAESILRFDHCPDNYIPGLTKVLDIPDLAGLVAPRWLAVENGIEDHIFAIEGFRTACERARDIYRAAGCANHFASYEFKGGHFFEGSKLMNHLARALG